MQDGTYVRLTLPNDLSFLPLALTYVRETARKFGFDGDELYKIEMGVEESVTNVIKHAFAKGERGQFDIICQRIPMGMKTIVKEKGIPFDSTHLPEYKPGVSLDELHDAGMGIYLMKKVMDEVTFQNLGPEGKETHLVKYLPAKSIDHYVAEADRRPAEGAPEPAVIQEKLAYDVRAIQSSEAIEVSRCAYKSHGYTFFDDHIYYPERLLELNESGRMLSAVAVTREGVFMGHAALMYPAVGAKIAELTYVFVNVEYRGQGCMNRLCEYLFTSPKQHPLAGVYAYAVTNHVFTQKVMAKYGINDCGLELATSPASWVFKGITSESEGNTQRISVALSFKYLSPPPPLTLYPPAHHREMIEKLYRNLHAEGHRYEAPAAAPALPAQESVIETSIHSSEQNAEIWISTYGANVVREVKHILRDLCLKQMAAINLVLNLHDPATAFLVSEFEALGFFFSGILPQTEIGDALILQYLNNVALDYDKIQVYTDAAKEILSYVKARDPNLTA